MDEASDEKICLDHVCYIIELLVTLLSFNASVVCHNLD